MNTKNAFAIASLAIVALAGGSGAAAQDPTDEDIKLFRKDLRSLRKQIIAANMSRRRNMSSGERMLTKLSSRCV
jgi:hypothetical protein